jgi:transposase InsO family protein
MSRRANGWDNAVVEVFVTLKRELVHETRWATRTEATQVLVQYIDHWYNPVRQHSSLGYCSPVQYEEQLRRTA